MKRSELKRKTPLTNKKPMARTSFARKAPATEGKPAKGPRPKKCANRECRSPYLPDERQPFKNWCSDDCGTTLAIEKLEKAKAKANKEQRAKDRKETREAKEKLKTKRDYTKEAQTAFNAFIRERDADKPCICCGNFPQSSHVTGGSWDAGHYRSVGSASHLRFHEDNVHRQLKNCNQFGAGRAVDYRLGLIQRIGLPRVEALEADQEPRKYTCEQLIAIRDEYRAKLRALKKSRESG